MVRCWLGSEAITCTPRSPYSIYCVFVINVKWFTVRVSNDIIRLWDPYGRTYKSV